MKASHDKRSWGRGRTARAAAVTLATVGCFGGVAAAGTAAASSPAKTAPAALLKEYLNKPTSIGVFPSLKKAPPKGKVVVFLATGEVSNVQVANGVEQAAKAAGWKFYTASYNAADPASMSAALNIAIAKHANYVMEAGTPLFSSFTSAAAAHHIKIAVDAVDPVSVTGPVIDSSGGRPVDYRMGQLTAAEFISDSHGKGVAVEEAVPQYPILTTFADGFKAYVSKYCSKCKVIPADVSITDLAAGKLASDVISVVKSNPSAKYLVFDDGPFADGVSSALAAQGVSGIKILGEAGDAAGFAALKTGSELAWTGYSVPFDSWEMMDAAFRNSEGMKVPTADAYQPTQIVTKANAGSIQLIPAIGGWNYPASGFSQFEKVWKLHR